MKRGRKVKFMVDLGLIALFAAVMTLLFAGIARGGPCPQTPAGKCVKPTVSYTYVENGRMSDGSKWKRTCHVPVKGDRWCEQWIPRFDVVDLAATAKSGTMTIKSKRKLPGGSTAVNVNVLFNGHKPQAVWVDSPRIVEFAWRGVLVTVNVSKKVGPMFVRVASSRQTPVRVYVRASW